MEKFENIIDFMQEQDIQSIERNENWIGIYLKNNLRLNCVRRDTTKIESVTILDDDGGYLSEIKVDKIESLINLLK